MWTRVLVSQELACVASPVLDQIDRGGHLDPGVITGLAGLRLHDVGDVRRVVDQPVLKLEQPLGATGRADALPLGLEQTQFANLGGDRVGGLVRHLSHHPALRRIEHIDAVRSGRLVLGRILLGCGHRPPPVICPTTVSHCQCDRHGGLARDPIESRIFVAVANGLWRTQAGGGHGCGEHRGVTASVPPVRRRCGRFPAESRSGV